MIAILHPSAVLGMVMGSAVAPPRNMVTGTDRALIARNLLDLLHLQGRPFRGSASLIFQLCQKIREGRFQWLRKDYSAGGIISEVDSEIGAHPDSVFRQNIRI